jgi:hypothetical protein
MKYSNCKILILVLCTLTSCMSTQLSSKIKPTEVTDLQLFEPTAYISLIEASNTSNYNDSLTNDSKKLLLKVVENSKEKIPITGQIIVTDSLLNQKLKAEFDYLFTTITPIIDSLLEVNNKRFGILTLTNGFTRSRSNYSKQVAKGVAVGLLTLGMYVRSPIKSSSTMCVLIVDAKDNNVAYFNQSMLPQKEPLDEKIINTQFRNIFKGYFLPRD